MDGEVDRNKATVEDNSSPNVDRQKATVEDSSLTVDRQKGTVEDTADVDTVNRASATVSSKWTLIFYIQDDPPPILLLKHIPKGSQTHPWNHPVSFGRREGVDIFLNHEKASRDHLELTGQLLPAPNVQVCFSIRNMSKTNSVFVNGQEIPRNQMHFMKSGDTIIVGCVISFKVQINPGEDRENYVLKFVHPQDHICGIQPVQEVESRGEKVSSHKRVTKQPSENKEDVENEAKPTQDTQKPKDID